MKKEENKVNFDLSVLSLPELIEVYEKTIGFIEYLDNTKIEDKQKGDEDND